MMLTKQKLKFFLSIIVSFAAQTFSCTQAVMSPVLGSSSHVLLLHVVLEIRHFLNHLPNIFKMVSNHMNKNEIQGL